GRTHGLSSGSLKIILDPQWQLTKRIYNGNATNHIYLSNTSKPENKLVSQAVSTPTPVYQQPNNYVPVPNFNSGVQPTNLTYQPPLQNNYQQPVYQQPVYATPPMTQQPVSNIYQQPVYQQPVSNLYQQPVYQQPVYVVPAIQPQPMSNVYQQPVYPVQPIYNSYRQ
ncbi:MAG: DUF3747 domain-containing protein, partial [Waterburya sp.]